MSCTKAQKGFEQAGKGINQTSDARKNPLKAEEAWQLICRFQKIKVGKGKKTLEFVPDQNNKDEILKHCLGRTGNLRAPAVEMAGTLYVGYNEEMYQKIFNIAP